MAFSNDLSGLFDPPTGGEHPPPAGANLATTRLAAFCDSLIEGAPGTSRIADAEIARAACSVLAQARDAAHPLVRERQGLVPELLAMMADEDWCLAGRSRRQVRALGDCFRHPDDLLPDAPARRDRRDDADMIARDVDDLQHELADWRDFCAFRDRCAATQGTAARDCHPSRLEWLAARKHAVARVRHAGERRREARARAAFPGRFAIR
jgi:hypothetical protein